MPVAYTYIYVAVGLYYIKLRVEPREWYKMTIIKLKFLTPF